MHCCSEEAGEAAGWAAAVLRWPSKVAVDGWQLDPCHQRRLSVLAGEEGGQ